MAVLPSKPGVGMAVRVGTIDEPSAAARTLTLSLLGPLDVRIDGDPVELGGAKPRALLALLLLEPGRSISMERLADELWERPPATAAKSVQVYVSRIRRALGPHANRLVTTA